MIELDAKQMELALKTIASAGVDARLRKGYVEKFIECAQHFDAIKSKGEIHKTKVIHDLIDFAWQQIKAKHLGVNPHFAAEYGLHSIVHFGQIIENTLLAVMQESERITIIGEDFGFFSSDQRFYTAMKKRIASKREISIFTPHPEFKPEPDRDNRLRDISLYVAGENWATLKNNVNGRILVRFIGIQRLVPYTAIMNEDTLWIKHELAALNRSHTFWVYTRNDHPEGYYAQIEADFKNLGVISASQPGSDLIDRYRPK